MPCRQPTGVVRAAITLCALLPAVAGCKDEKKVAAPAPTAASVADRVREAAESSLRAAGWPQMQFRGVQVYTQATAQRMAVCGQLDPFADDPNMFVPFVSVVTVPLDPGTGTPHYDFETTVGKSTSEASRVYVATVTYCWDKGGPASGPFRTVMPTPPLPDQIPPMHSVAPAAAPPVAADQSPAAGAVVMRQAGNLHSDPHGPSIKVIPQGTAMRIFAQAPGGWYQVGDTAPWGWVHESMLDRH